MTRLITCVLIAASTTTLPAADKISAPVNEEGITRKQADAILAELKAIRETLVRLAPATPTPAVVEPVVKAVIDTRTAKFSDRKRPQ